MYGCTHLHTHTHIHICGPYMQHKFTSLPFRSILPVPWFDLFFDLYIFKFLWQLTGWVNSVANSKSQWARGAYFWWHMECVCRFCLFRLIGDSSLSSAVSAWVNDGLMVQGLFPALTPQYVSCKASKMMDGGIFRILEHLFWFYKSWVLPRRLSALSGSGRSCFSFPVLFIFAALALKLTLIFWLYQEPFPFF